MSAVTSPADDIQQTLEVKLCHWVVTTLQKFDMVTHANFRRMIEGINSKVVVLSRQTSKRRIFELEEDCRVRIYYYFSKLKKKNSITAEK